MKKIIFLVNILIFVSLSCKTTNQDALIFFSQKIYPVLKKIRKQRDIVLPCEWHDLVINLNTFFYKDIVFTKQLCINIENLRELFFEKKIKSHDYILANDVKRAIYYSEEVLDDLLKLLNEKDPFVRKFLFNKINVSQWLGDILRQNNMCSRGLILYDINSKRFDGGTPLMFAAHQGSVELVMALLELGVDKKAVIISGHLAGIADAEYFSKINPGHFEICSLIREFKQ